MTESRKLISLVARNTKCYFKDKVTFFMSMISPMILFVLFVTFLKNVYASSFEGIAAQFQITIESRVLNGVTGAWLMSSILSVSSVTVAFCSNVIMIEDKMNSCVNDFYVTPIKRSTISISYFVSNFAVTFAVIMSVMLVGHIYLAAVGWYISLGDALMIVVDCICGILFGTLLAGVVETFITTQGGLSAVCTLVSSMYGFICGAYMPISTFSEGLRNVLGLFPGIYNVGAMRNHYMNGYINEMVKSVEDPALASNLVKGFKDGFDANLYLFGNQIPIGTMYVILLSACGILAIVYISIVISRGKKK